MPSSAAPDNNVVKVQKESASDITDAKQNLKEVPETIPEKNYENLKKIQTSKDYSKIFKRTIYSLTTIIIAIVFYFIYILYKRQKNKKTIVDGPPKETLLTPEDFKSAINAYNIWSFFRKWNTT